MSELEALRKELKGLENLHAKERNRLVSELEALRKELKGLENLHDKCPDEHAKMVKVRFSQAFPA